MRKITLLLVAIAAVALSATAAFAAVTFNPADGTGFIGRGDVITYVGKSGLVSNPTIQFTTTDTYAQSCTKDNVQQTIYKDFKNTRNVNYSVVYEVRKAPGNQNITGYKLSGLGTSVGDPVPTDLCNPGNADPSGWVADPTGPYPTVTLISSSGGTLTFNGVVIPY